MAIWWTVAACGPAPVVRQAVTYPASAPSDSTVEVLRAAAADWSGVPHRMGGTDRRGVDCSGLTMRIYHDNFDIDLPRTVAAQVRTGRAVPMRELAAGDLVFFRIGWKKQGHAGIYISGGDFVHASKSRGVMISNLANPYWAEHYWTARRIMR